MRPTAGSGYAFGAPMKEGADRVVETKLACIKGGKSECIPGRAWR